MATLNKTNSEEIRQSKFVAEQDSLSESARSRKLRKVGNDYGEIQSSARFPTKLKIGYSFSELQVTLEV